MRRLDIADVARRSGLPASTLRYYEEKGLIVPIGRPGLRRQYDESVLERLALIALGREALFDPYWPHHAAAALGADPGYERWPVRHGVWLAKRAPGLARARAEAAAASSDKETGTQ